MRKISRSRLSHAERERVIARVMEARFSLRAFDEMKRADPERWDSPRNDMGRGIYDQALRAQQRLQAAPDDLLRAELAAVE